MFICVMLLLLSTGYTTRAQDDEAARQKKAGELFDKIPSLLVPVISKMPIALPFIGTFVCLMMSKKKKKKKKEKLCHLS
jgi:hypothetical protein